MSKHSKAPETRPTHEAGEPPASPDASDLDDLDARDVHGARDGGGAGEPRVDLDDLDDAETSSPHGGVITAPPSIVNAGPGAVPRRSGPPPRPEMSLTTPAPIIKPVPFTKTMQVTRIVWFLSFGLAIAALLFAFFSHGARQSALEALVDDLMTDQDEAAAASLTQLLFWAAFAGLAAVTVLEAVLVFVMLKGRGGMRWALIPIVVLVHTPAALLADAFVAIDEGGRLISLLLLLQWGAAVVATVASLLPAAGDWFAAKRAAAPAGAGADDGDEADDDAAFRDSARAEMGRELRDGSRTRDPR